LTFVILALSGCAEEDRPNLAFPEPATEEAPRILLLWQGSWLAAIITGGVVWALIFWSCVFHRKKNDEIPIQTRYNVPIEALYTIIPFIMVVVLFYFTARDEEILLDNDRPEELTVNVVARQWSWTFNYLGNSPMVGGQGAYDAGTPRDRTQLWLPVNKLVRFELTTPDVIHSFWINEFLMKMDVMPGRKNAFELTPNKIGTYRGKCAELCGVDHSRMLFDVRVVSEQDFRAHIADLKAKGQGRNIQGQVLTGDEDRERAYDMRKPEPEPATVTGYTEFHDREHGGSTGHGSESTGTGHGTESTTEHGGGAGAAETEEH
jgi:cytochrome c oxidase subunit II